MNELIETENIKESFRDTISLVSNEGKRLWVYPKKPKGKFYNARTLVSIFLILFLTATPFIKLHNHPLLLFNVVERKFILFGLSFGPHDFFLFLLMMIAIVVFIILFTVIFGRVFCGWVCPQTVLMEMVFRKIEYWIEGDALRQRLLYSSPWNGKKILKKFSKYVIFFVISFIISNLLLSFIIGIDELWNIIKDNPSNHVAGLTSMIAFTTLFYWIFAWFREQACIMVCPYGRLQGVLLDQNSVVIAYDYVRGEPRGKLKKNEKQSIGDCVDCAQCVEVCPTGIDIRNGTQLECVNCTACIDACDIVMDKIKKPRGLIRFASSNNIKNKTKFKFTPRIFGYSSILFLLVGVLIILMMNRKDIDVNILRTPGLLFQEQQGDSVSNLYNIEVVNKTFDKTSIDLKLENKEGEIKIIGNELNLDPDAIVNAKFFVYLSKNKLEKTNTPLTIGVYSNNKKINEINTSFLGPYKQN